MQNSRRRKTCLSIIGSALVVTASLQSCSPDFLESDPGKAKPETGVLTMSYEAEMLTYQPLGSDEKALVIDRIGAMAKSARTKISIQVYEDGTSDWTMDKLTPKRNTLMKDLTPPDPTPQAQRTRVLRNGTGYFYDAGGKLLHTDPVPVPSFTHLLSRIKNDPTAANTVIGVKSVQEVKAMIASASRQGSIVQDLGNNITSIRSIVKAANRNARGTISGYKQVDMVHGKLGIVVGSSLYNETDELVCQTFYKYRYADDKTHLVPDMIHTKQWDVNPRTKARVETVTNTQLENIIVKNN